VRRTLLLGVLLLLPRITAAQGEMPDQPVQELFFTEVVYPQEKGEIQLTLGALLDRTRSRSDKSALMPLSVEYGLTNHWQIQAGWDGHTQFHRSPFKHMRTARVSVGTKYSLMNIAHSHTHAAFGVDVEFPHAETFAEGEGEEGMEIEPFAALAADLPWSLTVFGSVGMSFEPREIADLAESGDRPDDRGTISFGGLKAFRYVTLVAEYTNRSDQLPWRLDGAPLVTPSIVIHPGHQWELSAGLPIAVRHGQRRPGVAMNIIKEF
jgi:hypothetical protein